MSEYKEFESKDQLIQRLQQQIEMLKEVITLQEAAMKLHREKDEMTKKHLESLNKIVNQQA